MRALVNTAPDRLELQEWPLPEPGPGMLRVKTAFCGICATDLEMIAGWERTGFPSIPGHEWSGVIDAVGAGVDDGLIGSHCVAENMLSTGGEVGFEAPGGYGEYLLVEASNLYTLPRKFPLHLAALVEPLAVCIRAVQRLRIADRRRALVFGDGTIGLLTLLLLKRAGVEEVTVVGGRPFRLELARQLGAMLALDYRDKNELLSLDKVDYPNIVEASGSDQAMCTAFALAPHGGHVLVLGDYSSATARFAWNDLQHREIELIGSNASAGAWEQAVHLAVSGDLPLERIATHRFPIRRYAEAFDLARNREANAPAVRVLLDWEV
jgi:2-desacetyl-2-hydroxyethyl bacteriochlorophyllide A dehydrogenase